MIADTLRTFITFIIGQSLELIPFETIDELLGVMNCLPACDMNPRTDPNNRGLTRRRLWS